MGVVGAADTLRTWSSGGPQVVEPEIYFINVLNCHLLVF